MKERRKQKITLEEVVKVIFRHKDMELNNFEFVYWRDFEDYGNPEPVRISDISNGLLDGKYSLMADVAQISNIDEDSFKILNFCATSAFKEDKWYDITYTSSGEEYFPHPGQADDEYFENRAKIIKENIKEALEILTLFFNRYK